MTLRKQFVGVNIKMILIICLLHIHTYMVGQCDYFVGQSIEFNADGGTTSSGYSTIYILSDDNNLIVDTSTAQAFTVDQDGDFKIYALNYSNDESLTLNTGDDITSVQLQCFSLSQPYNISLCPNNLECYGCEGQSVEFSTVGGAKGPPYTDRFVVTDLNDVILVISESPSFSGLDAGLYKVFAINYDINQGIQNLTVDNNINLINADCYDISNPVVFEICASNEIPELVDRSICSGEEIRLAVSSSGYMSYDWSTGSKSNFITVAPTATTSYGITVTNMNGCIITKSVIVTVLDSPILDLGSNIMSCTGESVMINSNITADQYQWSTGDVGPSITVSPSTTTMYTLTITDSNGCTADDMLRVIVDPTVAQEDEFITLCRGEQVELFAGVQADSYAWSTGANTPSIIVMPTDEISYSVVSQYASGCTIDKSIHVDIVDNPSINLNPEYIICSGGTLDLVLTAGLSSYVWSNGSTESSISITPTISSTLSVTVTNDEGCTAVQATSIQVLEDEELNLGDDFMLCQGFAKILSSNVVAQSYLWSTGETSSTIEVSPMIDQVYGLTVTFDGGCQSMDELMVMTTDNCTPCMMYDCDLDCNFEIGTVEFSSVDGNASLEYTNAYLLVDTAGVILQIFDATSVDINAEGVYFIFSMNYLTADGLMADIGDNVFQLSSDCMDISDPYVIRVCEAESIISVVWKDLDGDGIFDVNEPVIENVIVNLYSCDGTLVASTTTDAQGVFDFSNIGDGSYYLEFDISQLDGSCVFTLQNNGAESQDSDVNSDGITACFDVLDGMTTTMITAGVAQGASIGNFVWEDINGDGVQGVGEPGLPGVNVSLVNSTGVVIQMQTTNSLGFYTFSGIAPGDYYLQYDFDDEYALTFPNMGINNGKDSEVNESNGPNTTPLTTLEPGEVDLDWDAGLYRCVKIGELVWYDINENDIRESTENGINGLVVNLWRQNMDGSYSIQSTEYTGHKPGSPSDDGYYKFCAPPGTYYVEVVLPPYGLVPVVANVGFNDNTDSDINNSNGPGTSSAFTLQSNQSKCDLGAGYYPMAQIGDRVWYDRNQNGLQDDGEEGIKNVKVRAFNLFGDEIGDNTTDSDGHYNIDYLMKDDYYLQFEAPAGYSITQSDVGSDDQVDSDVDHSFGLGTTPVYSLKPGLEVDKVDVGLVLGVLPLDWQTFEVSADNGFNKLEWSTINEIDVDYFDIERKINDYSPFQSIAQVTSKGGQDYIETEYEFRDYDSFKPGRYYYRIKSVDMDGRIDYTDVKSVTIEAEVEHQVTVLPNPSDGVFRIECSQVSENFEEYIIYTSDGQEVLRSSECKLSITSKTLIDLDLTDYNVGVYWCKIIFKDKIYHKSLIKQ